MTIMKWKRTSQAVGRLLPITLWLLCMIALPGCGESPELKLQQAKIALANNKPERALGIIDSLLAEDPDNQQGLLVQARVQIALDRLAPAKLALDRLAKAAPQDPAVAEGLLAWSQKTIDIALHDPLLVASDEVRARYDNAWNLAQRQIDILASDPESKRSLGYRKALLDRSDIARLRLLIGHTRKMIQEIGPDTPVVLPKLDDAQPSTDQADPPVTYADRLAALKEELAQRVQGQLAGLESVLAENPKHLDAALIYLRAVAAERAWDRMFAQLQKLSRSTDLPLATADRAIIILLGMPEDSGIELSTRIDLGWNLLRATPTDEAESQARQIASARLLMADGQSDKAMPILEKLLDDGSLSADVHYLLAQSLYAKGEFERCKELMSRMFPAMESVAQVQALYGLTLWRLGEVAPARQALRRACELDPDDPIARDAFATLMTQQGFLGASGEDIEAYYQLDPENPRAIQFKLQHAAASGDIQAVASLLEKIASKPDHTIDQLRLLYFGNDLLGRHNAARTWASELVSRQADSLKNWLRLAATQLKQHDEAGLEDTLDQIASRFPDAPGREQLSGELYFQTQQYERAAASLGLAIEQDPQDTGLRIAQARALAAMGRFKSALTQVQTVLEVSPDDTEALALAARIAYASGESDQAKRYLDQINSDQVDPVKDPALAAQLKLREGDLDTAVQICTRAIASGNRSPMLRLVLAGVYQEKNELDKAEEHLVVLIRQYPNSAEAFAWLVQFYKRHDLVDRGIAQLKEAEAYNETLARLAQASLLRLDARLQDAIDTLGPLLDRLIRRGDRMAPSVADMMARIYKELGDEDAASAVYDRLYAQQAQGASSSISKLIDSWPSDSNPKRLANLDAAAASVPAGDVAGIMELSRRYALLGKPDQGLSLVQRGLSESSDNKSLLGAKAGLLLMLGRSPDAIKVYERVIELSPDDAGVRIRYALAFSADGQHPKAETILMELIRKGGPEALAARAELLDIYYTLGLNQRANSVVSAALDKIPIGESEPLDLVLGRALIQMGRHEEARHRMGAIEPTSVYYAPAQLRYARSEIETGDISAGKARIQALIASPQTVPAAISLMLRLKPDDAQDGVILQTADNAIDIDALPNDLKAPWLKMRLRLADGRGDWTTASQTLDALIEMRAGNPTSMLALRIALAWQQGQHDLAQADLDSSPRLQASSTGSLLTLALNPSAPVVGRMHPMAGILKAISERDQDALQSASEGYADIRTLFPDDLLSAIASGGDPAKVSSACRDLAVAVVAMQGDLPGLAGALSRSSLVKSPGFLPAYALLAASSASRKTDLPKLLKRVRAVAPDSSLALMIQTMIQTAQDDHAGAVASLKVLTERHPGNRHLAYQYAQELGASGQDGQAVAALREITSNDGPYRLAASNDLAYMLAKQGGASLEEAAQLARSVLKAIPDSPVVMDTAGWAEHQRGRDKAALKLLSAAISSLKDEPEAHYHLGATYLALGQTSWARYHLTEAAAGEASQGGVQEAKALLKQMGDATGWQ